MPFEFGDVVLVPFPFTNQAASKKRPAVVVSSHAYNTARLDVVVMAITSQVRMIATSDVLRGFSNRPLSNPCSRPSSNRS